LPEREPVSLSMRVPEPFAKWESLRQVGYRPVLMEDDSTQQQSMKSFLKVECLEPAIQIVWGQTWWRQPSTEGDPW
jgi:hypothetical protein